MPGRRGQIADRESIVAIGDSFGDGPAHSVYHRAVALRGELVCINGDRRRDGGGCHDGRTISSGV